jgi:hypothetical protein
MKYYFSTTLIFFSLTVCGQINDDYLVLVNGDTLTISLSESEMLDAKKPRIAELKHLKRRKKKILFEKVSCEMQLKNNDTVLWAGIVDYYDNYLIALTGTLQQKAKNESVIVPIGF